jgi:hypothetical protein
VYLGDRLAGSAGVAVGRLRGAREHRTRASDVHQTRGVKIKDPPGDIRAPEVVASVIYADEIKANSVSADAIYVRDLRRR